MYKIPRTLLVAGALGAILVASPALSQDGGLKGAAGEIKQEGATNVVSPESLAALKAMGEFLAKLQTFDLTTDYEVELALDNEQKVDIGGTSHYLARRPDALKVELDSDLGIRDFLFDGKSFYIVAPEDKAYAQLDDVGPTIKDALTSVAAYADVELPLADLFSYGSDDAPDKQVVEGFLVGDAVINGQKTTHWAFRTDERNFQVWIKDGDQPLPLKIKVEDADPGSPSFTTTLTWSLEPKFADNTFVFTPPEGADKIPIMMRSEAEVASAQDMAPADGAAPQENAQ